MRDYEDELNNKTEAIRFCQGELSAMILAGKLISGRTRELRARLRLMRQAEARIKASLSEKKKLVGYKDEVSRLKKRISDEKERKLREELNQLELNGKT